MMNFIKVYFLIFIISLFIPSGHSMQEEQKLQNFLIDAANKSFYNKYLRPVEKATEKVRVNVSIQLTDFVHYNEELGFARFFAVITVSWKDPYFTWKVESFGINQTQLPLDRHWIPSIDFGFLHLPMRRGQVNNILYQSDHPSVLQYDGVISRSIQTEVEVTCAVATGTGTFPNDIHQCDVVVESLVYDVNEVDFNLTITYDESTSKLFAPGWKVINLDIHNLILHLLRHTVPLSSSKILIQRQGAAIGRMLRFVYPFTIILLPFLFYIHAIHTERIVLSFLLLGLTMIQFMHMASIAPLAGPVSQHALPSIMTLWGCLILLCLGQFVWFVYAYHLSVQLSPDLNPSPLWKRLFLNNFLFGRFIKDYPRRYPASPRAFGYHRGFENPLESASGGGSQMRYGNQLVFQQDTEEEVNASGGRYEGSMPPAEEGGAEDVGDVTVVSAGERRVASSLHAQQRASASNVVVTYSDWQLICIALDGFLFFVFLFFSLLFNFLFLLES